MSEQGDRRNVAVHLQDRARVASMYFQALTRRQPAFHLLDDVESVTVPPDTDDTLRLPAVVDFFPDATGNWEWYVVALSYRAMTYHPTLGTFTKIDGETTGRDLVRDFLAGCSSPALGIAVFGILDGVRLDAVLARTLPGLRAPLDRVRDHALEVIDLYETDKLAPRAQVLTSLVAGSLVGEPRSLRVSPLVATVVTQCYAMLDWMATAPALQTALSAAGQVYELVSDLPPMSRVDASDEVVLRRPRPVTPPASVRIVQPNGARSPAEASLEGMEQFQHSVPNVLYRGTMGSRHFDHRDSGRLSDPAIIVWRDGVEGEADDQHHHHAPAERAHEDEDRKPPEPIAHEHGEVPRWEVPHVPPMSINAGNTFHYPEWDAVQGAYRPNWCRVIEESLEPAAFTPYGRQVLDAHRWTLKQLLREWSRLPDEGLTLVRSLPDGDYIDIDAAIELKAELRAGSPTNGNVYTRKVRMGRDVVCAVLIDVSMSTADHMEVSADEPFTVDETAMHLYGKPYRTVLDHERETAVLMTEIMERVSDLSLVWSFSSTGRNLVRLQRIKGLWDRASIATASRLQKLRPLDATRMGAAVRHATAQLRRTDARSKILIVISDGLPYDEDYGNDYGGCKDAYAVSDTIRAFDEAEAAGAYSALFLTGQQDMDRFSGLGLRVVQVPHPGDLARAVMSLYLRVRGGSTAARPQIRTHV